VSSARLSSSAPAARRALVFAIADRRGEIDEAAAHALVGLRAEVDSITVVGGLSCEGVERAERIADAVHPSGHPGEVGAAAAWSAAADLLSDGGFDEVVFTGDQWLGPVGSFAALFDRMASSDVALWSMTDRAHDAGDGGTIAVPSLEWIVVRPHRLPWRKWAAFLSEHSARTDLGEAIASWIRNHALTWGAAFPGVGYNSTDPALFRAVDLMDSGCPIVSRRIFTSFPPLLDKHAVIGRDVWEAMIAHGYPGDSGLSSLVRSVAPKDLHTNLGLHSTLFHDGLAYDKDRPLRVVVIAHIFYPDMTDEILDLAERLPGETKLVVTTPDHARADEIERVVSLRWPRDRSDVRVVESNNGRDQSAFLVGCRDILLSGEFDVVVKLHSKKTPQDGFNVGRHFKQQQFLNLLGSEGYAANVIGLFQRESGLGLVFPPTIHFGYPTLGRGWWSNKPGYERLSRELGIRVPEDEITPLAPYGSMFFARPEALRLLVEHDWSYQDFGGAEAYRDGGLAHVLERVPVYAAAELGYHSRTIATPEYMAVSHTSLEFNLDQMSATIPGDVLNQIRLVKGMGFTGTGTIIDFARMYVSLNHPHRNRTFARAVDSLRRWRRALRRINPWMRAT
jgi:rhamnosyltransferase